MKVCVVGLGSVGLPTAIYVSEKNYHVIGYDISPIAVQRAISRGLEAYSNWENVNNCDTYIVCVSTLLEEGKPDFSPLFDLANKLGKLKSDNVLVSIESTVIPGTCKDIYKTIGNQSFSLVHVPHRYWEVNPGKYGVKQQKVIGAIDGNSLKKGIDFYKNALEIPLHITSTIEIAEMSKILENAYRYLLIAFAEESRMICEGLGLDFEEVKEACNTKWNTEILEARDGIGGHCIPKDTKYVISISPNALILKSAIEVDRKYRDWISKFMRED